MTKHILAVIGLLALTYPAQAQNVIPPTEFDFPYKGKLTIERSTNQAEIKAKCPPPHSSTISVAAELKEGGCHILMADDDTIRKHGWTPEIVLRHEMGRSTPP